jgi:hypothetical protein
MIDSNTRDVLPAPRSAFAASGTAGGEHRKARDAENAAGQRPMPTPEHEVLSVSPSVFQDWPKVGVKKRGLLWTFKKGGQFGTDELTITVVDIVEKRVKISARLGSSDITCSGPASLELHLVSMTLLVEEVSHQKTKLRIISRQRVTIRRE